MTSQFRVSSKQSRLNALYESSWDSFVQQLAKFPMSRMVSCPFLINVDSTSYETASTKLVIVGQQTGGWGRRKEDGVEVFTHEGALKRSLDDYAGFALGSNPNGKSYLQTPFWQACHQLYGMIDPISRILDKRFVWANLLKVDECANRPKPDLENFILSNFNLLSNEIAILEPEAVVFFTGPNYDSVLGRAFNDVQFESIPNRTPRTLARVVHPSLPRRSFRTYHPKFLRIRRQWDVLEIMAGYIRGDVCP